MFDQAYKEPADRSKSILDWYLEPSRCDRFWTVYTSDIRQMVMVVFKGSGGTWDGAITHPSSPLTRLRHSDSLSKDLFTEILNFIRAIRDYYPEKQISCLGFSLGGLVALVVAHEFGNEKWFKYCHTFNAVAGFVPPDWHALMREKEENKPIVQKITNWMIGFDPLSSGFTDRSCARPMGTTYILPARTYLRPLDNHEFYHFSLISNPNQIPFKNLKQEREELPAPPVIQNES